MKNTLNNLEVVDDVTFTSLTQEGNRWYGSAAGATDLDSNGDTTSGITFPAGMTIYGRWTAFKPSAAGVICYFGK